MDKTELLVQPDRQDHQAPRELMDKTERLVQQAHQGPRELMDKMERLDQQGPLVQLDPLDLKDHKENKGQRVLRAFREVLLLLQQLSLTVILR